MDTFREMIMPAWARLYIEISAIKNAHTGQGHKDRLEFYSDAVMSTFITLAGFDPRRAQVANLEQQYKCLETAREMDIALEMADEIYQLDGAASIEFAAGWMACRDMISALIGKVRDLAGKNEGAQLFDEMLNRALSSTHVSNSEIFQKGFQAKYQQAEKGGA